MTEAASPLSLILRGRLEERLRAWAREYLNQPSIDWRDTNILQTLIEHRGFIPAVRMVPSLDRTPADEVEDVVASMRNAGWWLHASVLRMDYWIPEPAMEQRLEIIRGWGVSMSRSGYYIKLGEAMMFVSGALFG